MKDRGVALHKFRHEVGSIVLVVSLKTGGMFMLLRAALLRSSTGVGLNLTSASNAYILDPWSGLSSLVMSLTYKVEFCYRSTSHRPNP